jgi:hypothetical protein
MDSEWSRAWESRLLIRHGGGNDVEGLQEARENHDLLAWVLLADFRHGVEDSHHSRRQDCALVCL